MHPAVVEKLRGVLAFPVSPFDAADEVDSQAVTSNATWLSTFGFAAIVAPSGTGEFYSLSADEVVRITALTVEACGGRVPVVASVGVGPRVAAELARRAEANGADAILMLPPYYARPEPVHLIDYYRAIASATSLPLIPYQRDSAVFAPDVLCELASEVPSVVAFKDGLGDLRLFQSLREEVRARFGGDRLVWLAGAGDDLVGPYYAAGADGFTSSLACFWPEAALELGQLARSGDFGRLRQFNALAVRPIYKFRQQRRGFEVSVMKAAMELLGYRAGPARAPLANLTTAEVKQLAAILNELRVPRRDERAPAPT